MIDVLPFSRLVVAGGNIGNKIKYFVFLFLKQNKVF